MVGASGSGKSTLCRCINRLETIDSGSITIDGVPLPEEGGNSPQLRADVGMVFQSFNLFGHKTVLENVILGPTRVRKLDRAEADEQARRLLHRVGVVDKEDKYPSAALRRPAAAGGHRPRAGDAAQGDALRRAHLGAGPRDDQGGPRRDDRARPATV